jgi:ATP-dependent protease ClpP protease subunit
MKNLMLMIAMLLSCGACKASQSGDVIELSEDNTVQLNLPIFSDTAAEVQKRLLEKDVKLKAGKPLYLVLNTPGGSIQDGLMIIETAKSLKRPIHTISMYRAL